MTPAKEIRQPPWRKLLGEAPALVQLLASQGRTAAPGTAVGGGRPVLVIPAFLANDVPTTLLRRTLNARGFEAYGWKQGMNLGARRSKFERLLRRIDILSAQHRQKVALVGWSLGGLYARELAKRRPDAVGTVVTLGTPFSHGQRANNAWKLYEAINDHSVDDPPVPVAPAVKPPMHTIAIWSRRDGIVAPASGRGEACEADEQIEVHCRHNLLVSDTQAVEAIVDALARAAEREQRAERTSAA